MITQALHLLRYFFADVFLKSKISGNHGAAEHEVLPYHDAEFVADIVEVVGFVISTAPVPDHVHVGVTRRLKNLAVLRGRDAGGETVEGNHVGTLGEYWNAVHDEGEAL